MHRARNLLAQKEKKESKTALIFALGLYSYSIHKVRKNIGNLIRIFLEMLKV